MRVVGLTGGIACGKSVCSSHVASIPGVAVVDCDLIARKVVEPGRSGLVNIVGAFGAEVLQADGYVRCHQLRTSQWPLPVSVPPCLPAYHEIMSTSIV